MKKLASVFLALLLLIAIPCEAFATEIDVAAESDESLRSLIDMARNELARRGLRDEENTVIVDQDGVQIYLTGKTRTEDFGDSVVFYVEVVIINDTDKDVGVMMESSCVNGWNVYGWGTSAISAGKKKKAEFEFNISEADIFTFEEIEDIDMEMLLYDDDSYDTIASLDPVTVYYNAE